MKLELVEYKPKSWPPVFGEEHWTKRKCFIVKRMKPVIDRIQDFEVRDDDVWIVTLPKAGTTWMQEMVWLILNSFDFDTALSVNICNRSPFIEFGGTISHWDTVSATEMLKSPRLIKTHIPLPLLPQQVWSKRPKVIYVFRHPKDVAISLYYHRLSLGRWINCTLEQHLEDYIEEENWFFEHALEFWWLRHEPNVFYTSFERMKKDLPNVIQDVCNFLGVKINAEQLERLEKHLSFESMKNNICCSHEEEFSELREYYRQIAGVSQTEYSVKKYPFIRKGQAGGYKHIFTSELNEKYDRWIEERLKPHNVTLDDLLLRNAPSSYKI